MPDFVKLVNEDYKPFDFHQNNAKRIVAPGEDAIVPWNIAVTLFGHPNIKDIAPANERTKMFEKIRARHNFSAGLQTESEWETIKPHVTVIDVENNKVVVMLIDDPTGEHSTSIAPKRALGKETDIEMLQAQVSALTGQLQKLISNSQATPQAAAEGNSASPTAVEDSAGSTMSPDSVFNIPTSDDTATRDDPQAVTTGDLPTAGDDAPPKPQQAPPQAPAKKIAAKKVAAKK